ncbi:MAG: hypothetical protein AB7S75_13775 [Desulfococcaceae bacterium]
MHLEDTPVFRKIIVPWYDSGPVCLLTVLFMDMVFLFGLAGIAVVRELPEYNRHIWIPIALIALSLTVILSVAIRLIRRYLYRIKHEL